MWGTTAVFPQAVDETNNNSNGRPLRVLLVRLGSMGDIVHALPTAVALRAMFPDVRLGWAIEERWVELLATSEEARLFPRSPQKPVVDQIHIVNTLPWRQQPLSDETWKEALRALRELRYAHYDVAMDLQGAWKSAIVALLSGAPLRIGASRAREHGAGVFYNRQVIAEGDHVVQQNFSLLSGVIHLQADGHAEMREEILRQGPPRPEFPRDETHELWARQELMRHGLWGRPFAILNPGAGWGAKCWPAESYAEVARGLAELGVCSLINFGPGEEPLARAVEAGSRGTALAFPCTISQLVAVTRQARLFVGGDTGPMHVAAALGVPVVGVFGPTNPTRNGPYDTEAVVLRSAESVTNHSRRASPDLAMLAITPAAAVAAAHELLQRTRARGGAA